MQKEAGVIAIALSLVAGGERKDRSEKLLNLGGLKKRISILE